MNDGQIHANFNAEKVFAQIIYGLGRHKPVRLFISLLDKHIGQKLEARRFKPHRNGGVIDMADRVRFAETRLEGKAFHSLLPEL